MSATKTPFTSCDECPAAYECARDRRCGYKTPKRYCGSPRCTGDENCPEIDVCMCGSPCDSHTMGDGHSPVSAHWYCVREETDDV